MTALYIRVSKEDGKAGESESVQNQKRFLADYCRKMQITDYEFYIDDGYSGLHFNRPGFMKMLENAHLKTVITKDLSRLGRDYILTGYYMEKYFPEHGIRYLAVNDGIDTGKEQDEFCGFRAVLNDLYAKDISKKVRAALYAKKRAGLFIGSSAPYGYVKDGNFLVINPKTAETVRQIFRWYTEGSSMCAIAEKLNRRKIKTPSMEKGGKENLWSDVMIRRILENPTYIGCITQNKTKRYSYKVKKREYLPMNQWISVPDTHPPIVSQELFALAKKRLCKR